jgi:transposase
MKSTSYIRQLEENIFSLTIRIEYLEQRLQDMEQLQKENEALRMRLQLHEGPHTPPSQQQIPIKHHPESKKEPRKRGAPKGHKGATRPTPVPIKNVPVIADHCEKCGSKHIKITDDYLQVVIEDLPPPGKIEVTQFDRYKVECYKCGHSFYSKDSDCPQVGNFGIFLLLLMIMLKFHLRGPLRKVQEYLKIAHSFEISPKGLLDAILRVGNACQGEYERIIARIRKSNWCHIDETGFKVNGKKWWLWIFRSDQNDVLVVIRQSRGSKVVKEILGEDWSKPIIADGWSAYNFIGIIQRCWAHLLREVDALKDESDNGRQLSKKMHSIFDGLKEFIEQNHNSDERIKQKVKLDNQLARLVTKYKQYPELKKAITYLENGLGNWFTCLLYPGMEPTNNLAEQTIRESVIYRKIIGAFRSESGSQNYQFIASLLASWKLQGKNMWDELESLIRTELCLS